MPRSRRFRAGPRQPEKRKTESLNLIAQRGISSSAHIGPAEIRSTLARTAPPHELANGIAGYEVRADFFAQKDVSRFGGDDEMGGKAWREIAARSSLPEPFQGSCLTGTSTQGWTQNTSLPGLSSGGPLGR